MQSLNGSRDVLPLAAKVPGIEVAAGLCYDLPHFAEDRDDDSLLLLNGEAADAWQHEKGAREPNDVAETGESKLPALHWLDLDGLHGHILGVDPTVLELLDPFKDKSIMV